MRLTYFLRISLSAHTSTSCDLLLLQRLENTRVAMLGRKTVFFIRQISHSSHISQNLSNAPIPHEYKSRLERGFWFEMKKKKKKKH